MSAPAVRPRLIVNDGLPVMKNELHGLLRDGKIEEFNAKRKKNGKVDLSQCNLRGIDLRGMDTTNVDFSNSYLRQADLRGLDLRTCNLEGASINQAVISGAYFPDSISAEEIRLSHDIGTRIRLRK